MEGEKRTREGEGGTEENPPPPAPPPSKRRRNRFSDAPTPVPTVGMFGGGGGGVGGGAAVMAVPPPPPPQLGHQHAPSIDFAEATRRAKEHQRQLNERLGRLHTRFSGGPGGFASTPDPSREANGVARKVGGVVAGGDKAASLQERINAKKAQIAAKNRAQVGLPIGDPGKLDLQSIPVAPVSSLKVNVNQAREEKLKKAMRIEKSDLLETDPTKNKYFDPRLKPSQVNRDRRELRFVEQGTYITKAEKMRERAEMARIQEELRTKEKESDTTPQVLLLRGEGEAEDIPVIEWWDAPFCKNGSYDDLGTKDGIVEDRITAYVHHPIPPKLEEKDGPAAISLLLTKEERKKLRHQKRMEKEKERQSMIQMGLLPKPQPRVKLSNLMRVLATEASQDPTKVEAEVRRQVEERQREHEARNEERRPTKEEKKEKALEKVEKDKKAGIHTCVFRVGDLSNPQHRFKVNINAEQNHLTGCAIYNDKCNIVVVEGGSKGLTRFKKLMLRRIDWSKTVDDADEGGTRTDTADGTETAPMGSASLPPPASSTTGGGGDDTSGRSRGDKANVCVLVWEGSVAKQSFKSFMATPIPTENEARQVFRRRRVEHLWDLALAFPIDDETAGKREL